MNVKIYEHTETTYRGIGAEINECMAWLVTYAIRVRPQVLILESVGAAYKLGKPWFEQLWSDLRDRTGLDYSLTHVRMNAALVGGDVIRPRYFMVAHLQPFGVGLEFVAPRTMREVLADLPAETDSKDTDWGHLTQDTGGPARLARTIEWMEAQGRTWREGSRLPENTEGLEVPDFWHKERPSKSKRYGDENGLSDVYSHWYSTDAFSPLRWRADKPFGVVVAATLDRAVHPLHPRTLTYREAARFMSLPDTWSLRVLTEKHKPAELGKAVPSASAKWIAHWAMQSILGTPGEYAGRDDESGDDRIRTINVTRTADVAGILAGNAADAFWPETSDPAPAGWLIDRKARPDEWWQRDDELGIFLPKATDRAVRERPQVRVESAQPPARPASGGTIQRVPPGDVAALLEACSLTRAEAAVKLGVSVSRIVELTTDTRPKSWLNVDRWEAVQAILRG
jgi:site-specific DNA-cytosine methylase